MSKWTLTQVSPEGRIMGSTKEHSFSDAWLYCAFISPALAEAGLEARAEDLAQAQGWLVTGKRAPVPVYHADSEIVAFSLVLEPA